MATLISILIFLAVLFVLILVHEWGHYFVAKKTGMRVDEFAIGFPPRLFGWKRGETEYNLNALPIGGYVKIYGENYEEDKAHDPDANRAFSARPRIAQALVLVAGVTMNVLLAWAILFGLLAVGAPTAVQESQAGSSAALTVTGLMPGAPADGVLPPNAEITDVRAGEVRLETLTPSQLRTFVNQAGVSGEPLAITYVVGNTEETVSITPAAGLNTEAPDQFLIGVETVMVEVVRQPIWSAVTMATMQTWGMTKAIVVGLFNFFVDLPRGEADLSNVAGPVGIVGYVGDAAETGLVALLMFTAVISLDLAVINLLPIPALDGGRLVFVAIEAIIRRPLSPVWLGRVNAIGFMLLMGLMLLVTANDIAKLW